MKHRDAIEHLPVIGSDEMDTQTERAVLAHAGRCEACRGWLAARDLLAGELSSSNGAPESPHPDADQLALCAVRPQELEEEDRFDIRGHLAACSTCRRDLEKVQAAVLAARPGGRTSSAARTGPPSAARGGRWWLAAALVLAFVGGGLLVWGLFFSRYAPEDSDAVGPIVGAAQSASLLEPVEELTDRDLEGTTVIDQDRSLMVSRVTVRTGADVTLCAGERVVFGDGFQVASGARLEVGSGGRARRGATSPTCGPRGHPGE